MKTKRKADIIAVILVIIGSLAGGAMGQTYPINGEWNHVVSPFAGFPPAWSYSAQHNTRVTRDVEYNVNSVNGSSLDGVIGFTSTYVEIPGQSLSNTGDSISMSMTASQLTGGNISSWAGQAFHQIGFHGNSPTSFNAWANPTNFVALVVEPNGVTLGNNDPIYAYSETDNALQNNHLADINSVSFFTQAAPDITLTLLDAQTGGWRLDVDFTSSFQYSHSFFDQSLVGMALRPYVASYHELDEDRTNDPNGDRQDFLVDHFGFGTLTANTVPEPSSTVLIGLSGMALMFRRRQ